MIATKTVVVILCEEKILIVAIPPLLPRPPDFFDYNSARIPPPLFTITYPDGLAHHPAGVERKMVSFWYSDSSRPFYFDMLCQDSNRHRFQINLKPDLSSASLLDTNINLSESLHLHHGSTFFQGYRICDDILVSWHRNSGYPLLYTGLTSATFSNVIPQRGTASELFLHGIGLRYNITLCPASGRLVRLDASNSVAVLDFF